MRPYVHTVLILDQVCTNYDPQGLDGDTKEEVRILKVEQGVTCWKHYYLMDAVKVENNL